MQTVLGLIFLIMEFLDRKTAQENYDQNKRQYSAAKLEHIQEIYDDLVRLIYGEDKRCRARDILFLGRACKLEDTTILTEWAEILRTKALKDLNHYFNFERVRKMYSSLQDFERSYASLQKSGYFLRINKAAGLDPTVVEEKYRALRKRLVG